MANVLIKHPDGRAYEISEDAFKDLYAPAGFEIEAVMVGDEAKEHNAANVKAADKLIETVPDHDTQLKELMARTDMQTNGVSTVQAYKHYGLPVPDNVKELEAAAKAESTATTPARVPANAAPVNTPVNTPAHTPAKDK